MGLDARSRLHLTFWQTNKGNKTKTKIKKPFILLYDELALPSVGQAIVVAASYYRS